VKSFDSCRPNGRGERADPHICAMKGDIRHHEIRLHHNNGDIWVREHCNGFLFDDDCSFSVFPILSIKAIWSVASRPRFGCYSQVPTGPYWGLLMPTVISVSTCLPISSLLSACYCLDRRCVLKSLVTSEYGRIISSASTTIPMYTCLLRATWSSLRVNICIPK
jgi:hypothetical protein